MMKLIKYIVLSIAILVMTIGTVSSLRESAMIRETRVFDAEKFKEMKYTGEELALFCDVAFMSEDTRIRKWRKDIKVEIRNINRLDRKTIAEVDSVIALLAPLVAPLKMERVNAGGNLHVYRKVKDIIPSRTKYLPHSVCINGMTKIGARASYSWAIDSAAIYDCDHADPQTLLHEFQHALGLTHPVRLYPYYITIGRSVIPQYFRSQKETQAYLRQPFYLSEEEKTVIKMLYSTEVRSGLQIETFVKKMGFSDEEKLWLIPEASKRKAVVIYPLPSRH
jgi:hypothetical protein